MENKKFLTEENYEKGKKKVKTAGLMVLITGLSIGGTLIFTGVMKQRNVSLNYSNDAKQQISEKLTIEKATLDDLKIELENKIKPIEDEIKKLERVSFTGFNDAYYERKDKIEELQKSISTDKSSIKIIENALDENFNYCLSGAPLNNANTSKYCELKNELKNKTDFNKRIESSKYIPFYMIGGFISIASIMISMPIFFVAKRRELLTYGLQSVLPIAQEGIETIAPTIGKAGASVAKEMAPVYGQMAKEISKGIKEGLSDDSSDKRDL